MQLQELIVLVAKDILHPVLILSEFRLTPATIAAQFLASQTEGVTLSASRQIIVIVVGGHLLTSSHPGFQNLHTFLSIALVTCEQPQQAVLIGSSSIAHGVTIVFFAFLRSSSVATNNLLMRLRCVVTGGIGTLLQCCQFLLLYCCERSCRDGGFHSGKVGSTIERTGVVVGQCHHRFRLVLGEIHRTIVVLLAGGSCGHAANYHTCNKDILETNHSLTFLPFYFFTFILSLHTSDHPHPSHTSSRRPHS